MASPPPEVMQISQDLSNSVRKTSDNMKIAGGVKKSLAEAADHAASCAVRSHGNM
jgi:hypothetical protein